jgi:hypothetical protein
MRASRAKEAGMKKLLARASLTVLGITLSVAAIALWGVSVSSSAAAKPPSRSGSRLPTAPPRQIALYGHIRSLTRKGRRYEMRFDPAWWLGGLTANRAAIEDGIIPAGDVIPNDYYVRDESHRLLTYLVPRAAPVTVLTSRATIRATQISVTELAQIVKQRNPRHRPLFDPTSHLGFWVRVATDTVRSLDQQYQP